MHDKLHLWFHNPENRYKVIKFLSDKKGFPFNKDFGVIVDVERPVFVKDSRRFIIDLVVDLVSQVHCGPNINNGVMTVKSFAGQDFKIAKGNF